MYIEFDNVPVNLDGWRTTLSDLKYRYHITQFFVVILFIVNYSKKTKQSSVKGKQDGISFHHYTVNHLRQPRDFMIHSSPIADPKPLASEEDSTHNEERNY